MYTKVLVAIDGSPYSKQALPEAIELAKKFGASLFVLHVAEHDRGRAAAYVVESPADGTRMVADAVKQAHDAGVSARGELVDRAAGHVPAAIAEAATKEGADVIVMGTRGLSDAQGVFLGSVTHSVVRLVDVPVLITRARRQAKAPLAAAVAAAE